MHYPLQRCHPYGQGRPCICLSNPTPSLGLLFALYLSSYDKHITSKVQTLDRCLLLSIQLQVPANYFIQLYSLSEADGDTASLFCKRPNSFAHAPINRIALSPRAKTLHKGLVPDIIRRLCIRHTKAFL